MRSKLKDEGSEHPPFQSTAYHTFRDKDPTRGLWTILLLLLIDMLLLLLLLLLFLFVYSCYDSYCYHSFPFLSFFRAIGRCCWERPGSASETLRKLHIFPCSHVS